MLMAFVSPTLANAHKSDAWARTQFDTAEKMRAVLNAQPADGHSRHDYQQVIDAYRRIYFGAPSSGKADPSAAAVGDLLTEMGRRFADDTILHKAIRQYEFLRREYPSSRARADALFAIGQIYQNDLGDSSRAKATFEEFMQKYPRSRLADQAQQALAAPESPEDKKSENKKKESAAEKSLADEPAVSANKGERERDPAASPAPKAELTRITAIRHWAMDGSSRVSIDLQSGDLQTDDPQANDLPANDLQSSDPQTHHFPQNVKFEAQQLDHPYRIYFDLADTRLAAKLNGKTIELDDPFVKKIRIAQFGERRARVVLEVKEHAAYDATLAQDPPRLVINIRAENPVKTDVATADAPNALQHPAFETPSAPAKTTNISGIKKTIVEADDDDEDAAPSDDMKPAAKSGGAQALVAHAAVTHAGVTQASERAEIRSTRNIRAAQPTASGDRSLIRALGLKIGKIVIDPGHGGFDAGTIGPNGLTEKDLVLDVSQRLGRLLESRLGAEVDYTRDTDTFVPLEDRTAIANRDQADLFVSIHANSSRDPDARGVETYYLNFTTSRDALDVAARENAVSDQSIYELQDLVKQIALKEKIEESREFASDVQTALHSGLAAKNPGLRDRGVKSAPFIVLIGANMPSILAEISFVSNPTDERKLKTAEYRQRIAESLYRGISKYVNGLSGVKVASKIEKSAGQ